MEETWMRWSCDRSFVGIAIPTVLVQYGYSELVVAGDDGATVEREKAGMAEVYFSRRV